MQTRGFCASGTFCAKLRIFIQIIVKPTKDTRQIVTPEYSELLKQRNETNKDLRSIENTIHASDSEMQEYGRLKTELEITDDVLDDMQEELLWGPRIIKRVSIEPYYTDITLVCMKPGDKKPSYEHLPRSRTPYKPTKEEKKRKNIVRVNWGRKFLLWNDLTSEEKSEVTQKLQALDEQLDRIMIKV